MYTLRPTGIGAARRAPRAPARRRRAAPPHPRLPTPGHVRHRSRPPPGGAKALAERPPARARRTPVAREPAPHAHGASPLRRLRDLWQSLARIPTGRRTSCTGTASCPARRTPSGARAATLCTWSSPTSTRASRPSASLARRPTTSRSSTPTSTPPARSASRCSTPTRPRRRRRPSSPCRLSPPSRLALPPHASLLFCRPLLHSPSPRRPGMEAGAHHQTVAARQPEPRTAQRPQEPSPQPSPTLPRRHPDAARRPERGRPGAGGAVPRVQQQPRRVREEGQGAGPPLCKHVGRAGGGEQRGRGAGWGAAAAPWERAVLCGRSSGRGSGNCGGFSASCTDSHRSRHFCGVRGLSPESAPGRRRRGRRPDAAVFLRWWASRVP